MASVLWSELTAEELREKASSDAIVVLPVASVEQHGPHLGTGVDTVLCGAVCKAAAERVGDGTVVVAPTLWCGMAEHHMAFGGTFTLDIPTYRAVLLCLLKSLERHGFRRVLIVNGHGGNVNALAAFLPDFARETTLTLRVTTYFLLAKDALPSLLEDQRGVLHACEVESSMMMAVAPDAVRRERLGEAYGMLGADIEALMRPVVGSFSAFADTTPTGVAGDARKSSRQKGEKLLSACAEALAATLREPGTFL
ncbi:MAG: creatininase [Chelatococcus sp.]|nr:MAG: creatininase [Chelatococcus sp.]